MYMWWTFLSPYLGWRMPQLDSELRAWSGFMPKLRWWLGWVKASWKRGNICWLTNGDILNTFYTTGSCCHSLKIWLGCSLKSFYVVCVRRSSVLNKNTCTASQIGKLCILLVPCAVLQSSRVFIICPSPTGPNTWMPLPEKCLPEVSVCKRGVFPSH